LTPSQETAIESVTRGLVAKIAHGPIAEIRRGAAEPDGAALLRSLRRAFRLDEAVDPTATPASLSLSFEDSQPDTPSHSPEQVER
ncbi:MAG: hypothetical protein MUF01_14840, partial [Bryobacterales bacterium]|nr:hypothetical protein [Bryobacterales bacterium]